MTIYNGKIKTRYGEYIMPTKYKALILLSPNVNVSKQFTDAHNKEFIFMDCYSNLEDIEDALNINWNLNEYPNVILVGDSESDYQEDSEFNKWRDKYFRYASVFYIKGGLLNSSHWESFEGMLTTIPYFRGEIYGWFKCARTNDEEL